MPSATHGAASVLIAAPPDQLYRLVSDVTSMGERSPECYRCEWLDGATEAAVGARFKGYNKLGPLRWSTVCHVTVAHPGTEFSFVVVSSTGREETRWKYVLEPVNGGVQVTESYQFLWCPLIARILELPFPRDRQLRRGMQMTLTRLRAAVEGTVAPHAAERSLNAKDARQAAGR